MRRNNDSFARILYRRNDNSMHHYDTIGYDEFCYAGEKAYAAYKDYDYFWREEHEGAWPEGGE